MRTKNRFRKMIFSFRLGYPKKLQQFVVLRLLRPFHSFFGILASSKPKAYVWYTFLCIMHLSEISEFTTIDIASHAIIAKKLFINEDTPIRAVIFRTEAVMALKGN